MPMVDAAPWPVVAALHTHHAVVALHVSSVQPLGQVVGVVSAVAQPQQPLHAVLKPGYGGIVQRISVCSIRLLWREPVGLILGLSGRLAAEGSAAGAVSFGWPGDTVALGFGQQPRRHRHKASVDAAQVQAVGAAAGDNGVLVDTDSRIRCGRPIRRQWCTRIFKSARVGGYETYKTGFRRFRSASRGRLVTF